MASQMVPSYLDRMLTTPTDPTLQTSTSHDALPEVLMRPPGINTLTDWGRTVAPSGKHATKTFAAIYEDDRMYVKQLWNRRGVSSWVRSFQLYCRERRAASLERQRLTRGEEQSPPRVPPTEQKPIPKMANVIFQRNKKGYVGTPTREEADWIQIPIDQPVTGENKNGKREMTPGTSSMETQVDQEKVHKLQTQIAILQRELQKETQGAQSTKEK